MELIFADGFANTGRLVLNFLAIAGGFLIGYVLTHVVLRLIAKFALNKRLPLILERALQVIGGLIVAFLVGLMVFGDGGWGFGGTGGTNPGGPDGTGQQRPDPAKDPVPPDHATPIPRLDPTVLATELEITVLLPTAFPKTRGRRVLPNRLRRKASLARRDKRHLRRPTR